ncbi:ATP-binding protein [Roseovarius sp. EL26]|uniref:ATP-binding protein n=1 Tax=Roseovarius sp. EL26 TaxID=2126672 RepID=UPI000EA35D57|nr:ATP-binding protein [Roseovarius sp. EL26]
MSKSLNYILKDIILYLASLRSHILVFGMFSVIFFIATIAMTAQVFLQFDKYRTTVNDNLRWSLTQMERDHLQFILALERVEPNDDSSIDHARLRYDILYSRIIGVKDGGTFNSAFSDTEPRTHLRKIVDTLSEALPHIDADNQMLAEHTQDLLAAFNQLTPLMRSLSIESIKAEAKHVAQERTILANRLRQLAVLSLVLLSVLLALLSFLWRSDRIHRKQALENLIILNRLKTILDTSLDAALVVKQDGTLFETNLTATKLLDFKTGQNNTPTNIQDILFRRDHDQNLQPIAAQDLFTACAVNPIHSTDLSAKTASGSSFPVELSAKITATEDDTVCVCFLRDISRRLQAEAHVAHARDKALAGERAKARFLAIMSHEMRTPLQGIFGTLDLLEDTPLNDEQERHLGILQTSSNLLLNQVNDAVEMLRTGETNVLAKNETHFNLEEMLSELVLTATPVTLDNNSEIKNISSNQSIGIVKGDQDKLRQVLLNLISNAAKFTINGTITVEAARIGKAEGDLVEIQVTDSGIGIDVGDIDRIFDEYVRLNDQNQDTPDGSGLGLSITKQLVQLMGGVIGVESEPGEGSVFWVQLPLPAVPQNVELSQTDAPTRHIAASAPQKILLVEDNVSSRMVLEQMLSNDGHDVQSVTDGETAISFASKQVFDLIFMDINLPGMSGTETAAAIRQSLTASESTRIVFLTAHAALASQTAAERDNKEEIYTKPLRKGDLRMLVANSNPKIQVGGPKPNMDFDTQTFHQFRASINNKELDELLNKFRDEGDALTTQLQNFEGQSAQDLTNTIHKLAGSCATFGANTMQSILNRAETAVTENDLDTAYQELRTLPKAWQLACAAMDTLKNRDQV